MTIVAACATNSRWQVFMLFARTKTSWNVECSHLWHTVSEFGSFILYISIHQDVVPSSASNVNKLMKSMWRLFVGQSSRGRPTKHAKHASVSGPSLVLASEHNAPLGTLTWKWKLPLIATTCRGRIAPNRSLLNHDGFSWVKSPMLVCLGPFFRQQVVCCRKKGTTLGKFIGNRNWILYLHTCYVSPQVPMTCESERECRNWNLIRHDSWSLVFLRLGVADPEDVTRLCLALAIHRVPDYEPEPFNVFIDCLFDPCAWKVLRSAPSEYLLALYYPFLQKYWILLQLYIIYMSFIL